MVTTALDVASLITVAAGVFFAARPWIGMAALIPAGVLVAGVSAWWARSDTGKTGGQP
jgi:hypothetical protein